MENKFGRYEVWPLRFYAVYSDKGWTRGLANMANDENKAIVRRVFAEALNRGNLDLIDQLFSADFVDHSTPEQRIGPAGVRDFFASVRSKFPDIHVHIDDIIAEDSSVVVRTTWSGTSSLSNEPMKGTLIQIFRLENGLIKEEWNEGRALS